MKRLFIFTILAAFCLGIGAQVNIPKGTAALGKSASKVEMNRTAKCLPKNAASLENTVMWGYTSVEDELFGVGAGGAYTYYAAYFVPGDNVLKGASINGVRVPFFNVANLADVSVWISKDLETNVVSQDVDASALVSNEYNDIALDEPYAIPEEGVFVGVKFRVKAVSTEADRYPVVCAGDGGYPYSLVLKIADEEWGDYSYEGMGSFAMQLLCSNLSVPEVSAYPFSASKVVSLSGENVSLPVVISSDGGVDVNSIDYTLDVAGAKTSAHLDLASPISAGFNKKATVALCFTAPSEAKLYDVNITIDKVNGIDNPAAGRVLTAGGNKVVTKKVARRTVVEEYTGTGCGYCPRGWVGMEYLKEHKENFIGVAFHFYNAADPMYMTCYPYVALGFSGAPQCSVDRKALAIEPYYGSALMRQLGIEDDFDNYNSMVPDVDVTVSGKYNEDYSAVEATAEVEYLVGGGDYTIAYVLTADSLCGKSSSWRQSNYFYTYNPFGEPLLDQFCRDGVYGRSSVSLVFNDVLIGSSYSDLVFDNSGKLVSDAENQAPVLAGPDAAGTKEASSYTVNMPTGNMLKAALDLDKVYIVALVLDSEGAIANAARAKVTGYDRETAISGPQSAGSAEEVSRYSVSGQRMAVPRKGVNIVKYSDGRIVKVVVR